MHSIHMKLMARGQFKVKVNPSSHFWKLVSAVCVIRINIQNLKCELCSPANNVRTPLLLYFCSCACCSLPPFIIFSVPVYVVCVLHMCVLALTCHCVDVLCCGFDRYIIG